MGYIKKLKNNELVGGTDKTTIYPVTSTEAVFEEITNGNESSFKSQKFLNNNITGDRINEGTITDYNIAVGTITKGKLTPQVQTMLDEGQKKALTPKGNYDSETEYEALDLVFDPVTNSSYISLVTPNVGHPVDENAEGYEEGWWEKTLDGTAVNTAQAAIDAKVGQLETQVGDAISQAEQEVYDAKQETLSAYTEAEELAQQITDWSSSEISSTPSYTDQHPLSNRASSAQVGYFECGTSSTTQASNQIKAVTAGGYALPTSGGAVKIKMYAANTYAPTTNNPVKLQFNADATTLKELRYNGEAVSPSNTWEDGEVISVYYDGSVYQASNAQGGGSAVGKKKLNGTQGYYVDLSGETAPEATSQGGGQYFSYIKYPVKEGDVVEIKGKSSSQAALVWGLIDSTNSNTIVERAPVGADYSQEPFVKVIPSGVDYIIINNYNREFADYEWYFAKKDSVGAHEMLTEPYLYGDLKTLAVGQTYGKNEAVKTTGKQLRKFIKDVGVLSLHETLAVGDLRINSNATYRAASAVNTFDPNPSTPYSTGAYALGSVTEYTLTVSADSITAGNITVNGTEVAIETTDDADAIASKIADALNIDGWTDSASENIVTVRCNTIGNNTTTITISVGDTGVVVSGNSTPSVTGTDVIMKYDGESWAVATPNEMATDGVLVKVDEAWLITNATEQNSITKELTRTQTVPLKTKTWTRSRFLQANSGSTFNTLVEAGNNYYVTEYMDCKGAKSIGMFCTRSTTCKYCGVIFYDKSYNPVHTIVNTTGNDIWYRLEVPQNAAFVRSTVWVEQTTEKCGTLTYEETIKDIATSNEKRIIETENIVNAIDVRLEDVEEELERNELIDYSILSTASHEANMRVTVDSSNNSVEFYCISAATSKRGALYLPDDMVSGIQYIISFDYSCNGTGDRYFAISNGYTAPSLLYYWGVNLNKTEAGHIEFKITYNTNMKLFVISSNSLGTNKHLIITNLSITEDLNFKSIQTRLDGLENTVYDIHPYTTSHEYQGEALSFKTHKFASELYMSISLTGTGQGGTNYGDFYFVGTNNGITFNVFNLKTKTKLGTFNVEAPSISDCHCNTLTFSNQFYEAGDEFPVLYVCSGYGIGNNPKTFCVYGYRIINNEGVFSATLVHTITLTASTGSWTEFIIDNENQQAFIKLDSRWYKRTMPTISDGDITINMDNLEYISVLSGVKGSAQGHMFYNGKIYFTADDLNTSDIHHLYVYDVFTGRYSAVIDTVPVYNAETENVFVYEEHLFIGYRSRIYKLYFD